MSKHKQPDVWQGHTEMEGWILIIKNIFFYIYKTFFITFPSEGNAERQRVFHVLLFNSQKNTHP
jgi:hypothetical protein